MKPTLDGPVVVSPTGENDIVQYVKSFEKDLLEQLHNAGAILFRGWNIEDPQIFYNVINALGDDVLSYNNRTSPRSKIIDKVYTSTDYPSDQEILPHNESSYAHEWPLMIGFYCDTPPAEGGETPISNNRGIKEKLPAELTEKFQEKGVLYKRNILDWIGLSWKEVYQTDSTEIFETKLRQEGISFEWIDESHLRLSWKRPALQKHPVSGDSIWFNHAYFYHKSNQNQDLLDILPEEDLPFCVYYGDGSEIQDDEIKLLRKAYEESTYSFKWEKGDILLLDNMLWSHARRPYIGDRKILVAMANPVRSN